MMVKSLHSDTYVLTVMLSGMYKNYAKRYGQQMPKSHKIELCVGSRGQLASKFQVHAEGMCEL